MLVQIIWEKTPLYPACGFAEAGRRVLGYVKFPWAQL